MRLFDDIVKDAGVQQVHSQGSLGVLGGNAFRFGRNRSQPRRKRPSPFLQRKAASWQIPLEIKKFDPDKQLIFGWASVVEKDGKAIIDKQGDVIPVEELENGAYDFVLNSRSGGDMHARPNLARLVESMVFTKDKQKALGIDLGQVGWWTGFKVHDDELWAAHKRGERPEFSIGGSAIPVEIDEP